MNTEWVNTQENVPHRFISSAGEALALAKIRRMDGAGGLWAMLDPTGKNPFALQPYVSPAPGVWPPVMPSLNEWTIDNVKVGAHTLRDWFFPGVELIGIDRVIRTTATATPVPVMPAVEGDIIGTRDVALVERPGDTPIVTRSLFEIGDLLAEGYKILRDDNTLAQLQDFNGGWLVDGNPLNVLLGRGWMPGQQEALAPAVAAGQVPPTTLDLNKTFSEGSSRLLVGGAIVIGLFFLARRR